MRCVKSGSSDGPPDFLFVGMDVEPPCAWAPHQAIKPPGKGLSSSKINVVQCVARFYKPHRRDPAISQIMTRTAAKEPIVAFKSSQELQAHMSKEPQTAKGFWLKLSKAGAPDATITKDEAIETALCCGWIDGQLAKLDDCYFLVRMTPRRPASRWSAKNRETADRLAKLGRLLPAGLAEVNAAKSDGRWDAAYASQGRAEPPEDLLASLRSNKAASRFFEKLDRANRYAIIYRVGEAKRPETRAKRIAKFVEMLARGETIHPPKEKA
jgi:uncharacterized protein YdeI (YjbR/CyaY-like superfamily)